MRTVIPDSIIGLVATYVGEDHPFLRGYVVKVVAAIKQPGGDPDLGVFFHTNEELAAAGGLDPEHDVLEVVPWLPTEGRWSWVSSDVSLADLADLHEVT